VPALKAKDLRGMSVDELTDRSEGLRKELFDLRFQAKLSKIENISKIKQTRRDLARVLTVRHEMESKNNG
jgi:large subunit ribosomal protein L29